MNNEQMELTIYAAAEIAAACDISGINWHPENGRQYLKNAQEIAAEEGWDWSTLVQDHYVPLVEKRIAVELVAMTMDNAPLHLWNQLPSI